jgi:hypothetical protein
MPPARRNPDKDSLAGAAGDRVRAIIEAAEVSAEAIRAEAEAEAQRITARAEARASALRSEVRGDVEALIGSIRDGFERLRGDLEALERRLVEPEGDAPPAVALPARERTDEEPDIALAEDAAVALPEPEAPRAGAVAAPDLEGARLVALNMALDDTPREEVHRHLRENYGVSEPDALLDEVYQSIGRS